MTQECMTQECVHDVKRRTKREKRIMADGHDNWIADRDGSFLIICLYRVFSNTKD